LPGDSEPRQRFNAFLARRVGREGGNDFHEYENDACIGSMLLLRERVPRLAFDCKAARDAKFRST
jgi:hypothetical protein